MYARLINIDKGKVKWTLVQALRLCTGRTAHRESRGIALLFHDHGTRRGWVVSVTPRPLFTPGKDPVPTVQEAGWVPGPVWTGAENLAPTGIRSPDRPARSQSLYRLRYPARLISRLQNIPWDGLSSATKSQSGPHYPLVTTDGLVLIYRRTFTDWRPTQDGCWWLCVWMSGHSTQLYFLTKPFRAVLYKYAQISKQIRQE